MVPTAQGRGHSARVLATAIPREQPAAVQDTPRAVRREDLAVLAAMVGVAAVVRDADCRITWCNNAATAAFGRQRDELVGKTPFDLHARPAAEERMALFRSVQDRAEPAAVKAVMGDARVVCTVQPLDAASFGHAGTLMTQVRVASGTGEGEAALPVLATPILGRLSVLSPRELDVLHLVACGHSTAAAAGELERSAKTVDKHIESIHKKLETSSRAELVQFAAERGLHRFSREEWGKIVGGYERVRRES